MESNTIQPSIGVRAHNFKEGAKTKFHNARSSAITLVKNFNTVKDTSAGAIRGGVECVAAASLIGLLGKNVKDAKGQIGNTITGCAKDIGKSALAAFKFVPSLITKAPIDNIKDVLNLPVKFYGTYLKGTPATAFLATAAGLGIFAFRTVQGKMTSNIHNSNVDHATITGHAKTQALKEAEPVQNKEVKEIQQIKESVEDSPKTETIEAQ